ncbi:HEAT repeat domain-containing protein [Luteolibacter sp.]
MKTRHNERYESDNTPSSEVARKYREVIHEDEHEASLALISYRGGEEEFRLGKEYCSSDDPGDRATGADILAQLGWGDQTFRDESIEILTRLLDDSDVYVVYCAAVGLGHRSADSAIPALVRHIEHPDPLVRYGVAFGLLGLDDARAIAGLIKLTADDDRDVRNWAVFGLGTQIDTDTPAIRDALREVLSDSDHEIRGEALVGLAKRGYPAIIPELINEWKDDDVSILSIEAAGMTRDPRLFHRLNQFTEILTLDDDPSFASKLADAIAACTPKAGQGGASGGDNRPN